MRARRRTAGRRAAVWPLGAALLLGCGSDPSASDSAAAEAAWCDEQPVLTYDNFGAGFLQQNCQACHASTTTDRNGAPAEVFFDDQDDVDLWKDRIIARTLGETPSMPPQGGVPDDDRARLEIWLTCWE